MSFLSKSLDQDTEYLAASKSRMRLETLQCPTKKIKTSQDNFLE